MSEPTTTKRDCISRDNSCLLHSPQKRVGDRLTHSLDIRLFVNDSKIFRVDAQEKLRNALPRKARLDINSGAVTQHLTMCSVMQLTISPQPKCRSSMWHFLLIPIPGELLENKAKPINYVESFIESIGSHKRYRCNVLAGVPPKLRGVNHG